MLIIKQVPGNKWYLLVKNFRMEMLYVTGKKLYKSNSIYESPTTGHAEVICESVGKGDSLNWINTNTTKNNAPYVKAKDVITLNCGGYIFRSHDFTFTIGNKTFQEAVCHKERIGGNDEWQIEIV
ncbi:unnamed protein product [Rhizophagus irregularis]|nr:unnamed protein product [Rhizophagus irregularis]